MAERRPEESELELLAIRQDMVSLVQQRLRARLLEQAAGPGGGLPHAPTAFTRVLERSVAMSPTRAHTRSGTRAVGMTASSLSCPLAAAIHRHEVSRSPGRDSRATVPHSPSRPRAGPQASAGRRRLRPKSAPVRRGGHGGIPSRPAGGTGSIEQYLDGEILLSEVAAGPDTPADGETLDEDERDVLRSVGTRQSDTAAPAAGTGLEEALGQLQSRRREEQLQGVRTLLTLEFTPKRVQTLAERGHLEALERLTSTFLRQSKEHGRAEDADSDPGLLAMQVMFKMGAVAEGFRAVAATIISLATPPAPDPVTRDAIAGRDRAEPSAQMPPRPRPPADDADPLLLGTLDEPQHLTWQTHSVTLQGLPAGNRHAVEAVAVGAMLWVYTMSRVQGARGGFQPSASLGAHVDKRTGGRAKTSERGTAKTHPARQEAFQTYVQLLPTGSLYIGGKEQHVQAISVVPGSSPELDEAFDITGERRACIFRIHAMPRACALASAQPVSLAFAASSVRERDLWIHGISVVILRSSAALGKTKKSAAAEAGALPRKDSGHAARAQAAPPRDEAAEQGPVYHGECDGDGVPCGRGVAESRDGSQHIGEWFGGMLAGKGAFVSASGDKYMGEWKEGLAHGLGVHLAVGGLRYEGEWAQDTWHGYGVESDGEGPIYCGTFADGKRHGPGLLIQGASARLCTYDKGELVAEDGAGDAGAGAGADAAPPGAVCDTVQALQRAASDAAGAAKRVGIDTSRLVKDIEAARWAKAPKPKAAAARQQAPPRVAPSIARLPPPQ